MPRGWRTRIAVAVLAGALTAPASVLAQAPASEAPRDATPGPANPTPDTGVIESRVDLSVDARLGRPYGYLRVGENASRGNRLRLHEDLGVKFSEGIEASAALHLTPRDAVRATFLYYFLRGQGLLDRSIVYNAQEFAAPGHVTTDADFYRLSLAYERTAAVPGGFLTGSVGLSYVHLNPKLTGHGGSNAEDFYRQELPVPIVGLRFDIPMGNGFGARAAVDGGGLPHVSSGRKEGGTVYLEQIHGDGSFGLTYAITRNLVLDVGPYLTYFFQHEKSHEDNNAFELIDYGIRGGLTLKF